MHLRRALLLMAVVLIAVGALQALVPAPRVRDGAGPQTQAPPPPRPKPAQSRVLEFRYPPPRRLARRVTRRGTHLIVRVRSSAVGQVELRGLGLVQPVEPRTPAVFDVLATQDGSYVVAFDPVVGRPIELGRVIVSGSGRRP